MSCSVEQQLTALSRMRWWLGVHHISRHWGVPFSLWGNHTINSFLLILAKYATVVSGIPIRFRTWQRCSWLAGVKPQGSTMPAMVFGDMQDLALSLARCCDEAISRPILRPVGPAQLGGCSISQLLRPILLYSWNRTSIRNIHESWAKVRTLKNMIDKGSD